MGGGRRSNCSMLEAIELCERIAGRELAWELSDEARKGDHRWWISDLRPFEADYPGWSMEYGVEGDPARDPRAERGEVAVGRVKLSVVIPAHNEAESIAATLHEIATSLDRREIDYEIIVVDDASSDGTAAVVEGVAADNARVRCLRSRYSNGFGFAVRPGWRPSRATPWRS